MRSRLGTMIVVWSPALSASYKVACTEPGSVQRRASYVTYTFASTHSRDLQLHTRGATGFRTRGHILQNSSVR